VVDPLGRVVRALPLGTEGVIDAPLPQRVAAPVYARVRDAGVAVMAAVALALVVRRRVGRG
jgi:apolipoprotein N-acyltransferase